MYFVDVEKVWRIELTLISYLFRSVLMMLLLCLMVIVSDRLDNNITREAIQRGVAWSLIILSILFLLGLTNFLNPEMTYQVNKQFHTMNRGF